MQERCDASGLVEQQATLRSELEIITGLMQRHISVNAHVAMDQAEYQRQYYEYRLGTTKPSGTSPTWRHVGKP